MIDLIPYAAALATLVFVIAFFLFLKEIGKSN
jgi:hypothetical protein